MKLKISKEQMERARQFARQRIDKSADLYKCRGEDKLDKMIEDIVIGTVGEFGVAKYLRSKGYSCTRPDLNIYETKRKSFEQDLLCFEESDLSISEISPHKVHVKSQSVASSKRYGNSWLLQKSDSVTKNPGKDEYFAFTEVEGQNVTVLGIVRCEDILKHELYNECKVPWYRHTKHALYFKDIEKELSKHKLWRL